MRDKQLHGEKLSTGQAIITDGYNLPAKYVIHTVGPVWNERDDNQEAQLADCYRNSLQLAARRQASHMFFHPFPRVFTVFRLIWLQKQLSVPSKIS
ncbi:macro domain-containing protein [Lentibacillus amyloliquefaciens]|uniref:macro domain-containing protein n=1 Tax=Lentibacillus amyloliquefaciens TaxID=1472767 RepID=UPI000B271544